MNKDYAFCHKAVEMSINEGTYNLQAWSYATIRKRLESFAEKIKAHNRNNSAPGKTVHFTWLDYIEDARVYQWNCIISVRWFNGILIFVNVNKQYYIFNIVYDL